MIRWFKGREKKAEEGVLAEKNVGKGGSDNVVEEGKEMLLDEKHRQADENAAETYDSKAEADTVVELSEVTDDDAEVDDTESKEVFNEGGDEDQERRGFFRGLRKRLSKTRETLVGRLDRLVLGKKEIDDELLDDLEEILITADLGVKTTQDLINSVVEKVKRKELSQPEKLKSYLKEEIKGYLADLSVPIDFSAHNPFVVLFIGVNGVGKTTTIAKVAYQLKRDQKNVMLVAADTFRAAAIEQLALWAERVQVEVVRQKIGADPSAVVYDALTSALARDIDVVLIDTAGRMHTKVNLVEELKKIRRVTDKKLHGAPHEILLVLDATTGQNALSQAKLFTAELGVSGLVLTKLDGTAKGGILVGICKELKIPVRYIGLGEKLDDLHPFDPDRFVEAIF